jgi:hypothetical protein
MAYVSPNPVVFIRNKISTRNTGSSMIPLTLQNSLKIVDLTTAAFDLKAVEELVLSPNAKENNKLHKTSEST